MRDLGGVRVHGDHPLADERGEHPVGVAALAQLAEVDGGAARRQIVGHVHQAQEQPPRQPLLLRREAPVRPLGGLGERVLDPAAGEVVGDGEHPATTLLPGGEHRMRQQRQRARLVRSVRAPAAARARAAPARARAAPVRAGWGQVGQQQRHQAVFNTHPGQPGGLGDRCPDLFRGHRTEHDLAGLQRGGQLGIADGVVVEIGAQREDHQRAARQLAERGDELAPLRVVRTGGEDGLELVHDDRRPPVRAPIEVPVKALAGAPAAGPGRELGEPGLQVGDRIRRRLEHRDRPGDAGRGVGQVPQPGEQSRAQHRRLAGPRSPHENQRQRGLLRPEGDELLRDILPAEKPARVLGLEPGQPPVRRVRPPARQPPGPLQRGLPLGHPARVGLAADGEDPDQLLAAGRQMAPRKIVARGADRDIRRPRHLPDLQPGALAQRLELAAEVRLSGDPLWLRERRIERRIDSH